MEYLKGGSLVDRLRQQDRFEEREAAFIMKQVFKALAYCHSKGIVHRDMKLENVIFTEDESMKVKIIDFGSACKLEDAKTEGGNRIVTAYYVSPEVIQKSVILDKNDVWSCGVMLFILLCGYPPFRGKTEQEILDKIVKGQYNLEDQAWKNISSRAKMLIKNLLEINPDKRYTI